MIDVAIVDDEPAARRTLREYCAKEPDFRVVGEFGDGAAALEAIRIKVPDLLFLDIQMDVLNGMALARALDPTTLPMIVFVTAFDQYALEAFEVSAIDYLLKPFDQERFDVTVARIRQRRGHESREDRERALGALLAQLERGARSVTESRPRLLAESNGRMHMLDCERIEVVEGDRNYVRLTVGRDSFHARSTLHQAEASLQSQPMLRISRSCLVNLNHVREISRTPRGDFILVCVGGTTVTSSEGYRQPVKDALEKFKLG